ncbi:EDSAP-1 family PEP-CTERM protein [Govanella unica]|uniref:PEP-CTERM sorting domain-containing protein n=1 Tax=Govanella unica TaxID=2975056 RepID=A0A9X3Z6X5_9PROT|nr:EDSAP-1 family PEP-CTERM protein [Govania unica]MDA5193576.1 PEP-CTERM sorting domain-containing protein [Govania unica]
MLVSIIFNGISLAQKHSGTVPALLIANGSLIWGYVQYVVNQPQMKFFFLSSGGTPMKLFKTIAFGLAAGVALAALALPVEKAEARVVAYSTLQVTNFFITDGAQILTNIQGQNNTNTSAVLASYGNVAHDDPQDITSNSNALQSCVGAGGVCGSIPQDDFARYSAVNTGAHFARSDADLSGNILTPVSGANAKSVAEVELNQVGSGTGASGIQSAANFGISFVAGNTGNLTLQFDAAWDIYLFSDEINSVTQADTQWAITLFDVTTQTDVTSIISFTGAGQLSDLNKAQSLFGPGTNNTNNGSDNFILTVSGLQEGHSYDFNLTHNTKATATKRVSEPAALGFLGLGLIGLAWRRRRSA